MKGFDVMLKNKIKEILSKEFRTNKYLVEKVKIRDSHLSNIINCKIVPKADLALRIAIALEKPFEDVFYFEEDKIE